MDTEEVKASEISSGEDSALSPLVNRIPQMAITPRLCECGFNVKNNPGRHRCKDGPLIRALMNRLRGSKTFIANEDPSVTERVDKMLALFQTRIRGVCGDCGVDTKNNPGRHRCKAGPLIRGLMNRLHGSALIAKEDPAVTARIHSMLGFSPEGCLFYAKPTMPTETAEPKPDTMPDTEALPEQEAEQPPAHQPSLQQQPPQSPEIRPSQQLLVPQPTAQQTPNEQPSHRPPTIVLGIPLRPISIIATAVPEPDSIAFGIPLQPQPIIATAALEPDSMPPPTKKAKFDHPKSGYLYYVRNKNSPAHIKCGRTGDIGSMRCRYNFKCGWRLVFVVPSSDMRVHEAELFVRLRAIGFVGGSANIHPKETFTLPGATRLSHYHVKMMIDAMMQIVTQEIDLS